ncbi:hypothetical protein AB1K32_13330 [Metabacillus dongyingensis]|uniref:hypothetical protein n=1 Tax=Metabacillus dongyingensis TaxID=2874282 RepID=UPI003B8DA244
MDLYRDYFDMREVLMPVNERLKGLNELEYVWEVKLPHVIQMCKAREIPTKLEQRGLTFDKARELRELLQEMAWCSKANEELESCSKYMPKKHAEINKKYNKAFMKLMSFYYAMEENL